MSNDVLEMLTNDVLELMTSMKKNGDFFMGKRF